MKLHIFQIVKLYFREDRWFISNTDLLSSVLFYIDESFYPQHNMNCLRVDIVPIWPEHRMES